MIFAAFIFASSLVRPIEYPFRPTPEQIEKARRVTRFEVRPMEEPKALPSPKPVRHPPSEGWKHVLEGGDLIRFWERPDRTPAEDVDAGDIPAKDLHFRRYHVGPCVGRFVEERNPIDAFAIYLSMVSGGNNVCPFAEATEREKEYFLRYAAAHGYWRARRFFDENGEPLVGREYEYVLAEYSPDWRLPRSRPAKGAPGYGSLKPEDIVPYPVDTKLEPLLERYALEARLIRNAGAPLPFLFHRPAATNATELPLVVYVPGCGEQGPDLFVQFRQRACIEKVTGAEFQEKHPCHFIVIGLPADANVNSGRGYPDVSNEKRNELYNDLVLAYAASIADGPKVDPARIYLTGLGSGATIAKGMALDHPGRFAAVAPVWQFPTDATVHPKRPGNWMFFNEHVDEDVSRRLRLFAENVRSAGGVCELNEVPGGENWWNAVWSGDKIWDWMFARSTPGEVEEWRNQATGRCEPE